MTIAGSRGAAGSQKIIFLNYYPIRSYWEVVLIKIENTAVYSIAISPVQCLLF